MLLTPKRRKYRKRHNKKIKGKASRWYTVSFWEYGLKAMTRSYVTNRQLESARKVIVRHIKKIWKIWMRVYPDVPITKLGLEMPMGKGKGEVDGYAAKVQPWRILFEITGLPFEVAQDVLISAAKKLPCKARVVKKNEIN